MRSTRIAVAVTTGVLAVGLLAGCGSTSSTTARDTSASQTPVSSGTPAARSGPTCQKVWKAGSTLPTAYHGCTATAGWVKPQVYQCEDGHRLVTYAHLYYASPGRSISRAATTLARDHAFRHVMADCGA